MNTSKRFGALFTSALFGCLLHCGSGGSDGMSMTPEGDSLAVDRIVGTWQAESPHGTYTLTLCENLTADGRTSPTCECRHVVRGDGRGKNESVDLSSKGCGGCSYDTSAFVVGSIQGGEVGDTQAISGSVLLKSQNAPDPYAYPYGLTVSAGQSMYHEGIHVAGRISDDDTMTTATVYGEIDTYGTPEYDAGDTSDFDAGDMSDGSTSGTDDADLPAPPPSASATGSPAPSASGVIGTKLEDSGLTFHRIDKHPAACAAK